MGLLLGARNSPARGEPHGLSARLTQQRHPRPGYLPAQPPAAMLTVGRRQSKPRGFHYEPRFHDPKEDERRKRAIRIQRTNTSTFRKTKQPQFIAVGLGLVLALYLYINADTIFGRAAAAVSALVGG